MQNWGVVSHLGWRIDPLITALMGQRWRYPGRGKCAECGERKPQVYLRGDGSPYCTDCIMFDLAEAAPSDEMKREQHHPDVPTGQRYEVRYDQIAGAVTDGADLSVYEAAFR